MPTNELESLTAAELADAIDGCTAESYRLMGLLTEVMRRRDISTVAVIAAREMMKNLMQMDAQFRLLVTVLRDAEDPLP